MTIRVRLLLCIGLLCGVLAVVSGMGYATFERFASMSRSIVVDRDGPLQQLKRMADAYAVSIVDTAHKVRSGALPCEAGLQSVSAALAVIDTEWAHYSTTTMTDAERLLAVNVETTRAAAAQPIAALQRILEARDQTGLDRFVENDLYAAIDPISDAVSRLVDLQVTAAQQTFQTSERIGQLTEVGMLLLALLSVGVAGFAARTVLSGVTHPIGLL